MERKEMAFNVPSRGVAVITRTGEATKINDEPGPVWTDRNEKAAGAICAFEERLRNTGSVTIFSNTTNRTASSSSRRAPRREQLQPRIIAIESQAAAGSRAELRKPGILRRERRAGIALSEIENEVKEGGDGARGQGLNARHRDRGRTGVRGEGQGGVRADETGEREHSMLAFRISGISGRQRRKSSPLTFV